MVWAMPHDRAGAGRNGIRSIPTLMMFKDGKHVATKTGAGPKSELSRWINASVGAPVPQQSA
jgi:thioredoxin-like negative regulator of GroEL